MRVISGEYRGRKLVSPTNNLVRPTTDRVKESLFSVLQNDIKGSVCCDLFAGSGALGIEALSRGAKKVYFCDNDKESIRLIKTNLSFVDSSKYEILNCDYASCLKTLSLQGNTMDIIFCDPPFAMELGEKVLQTIFDTDILNKYGVVTVEHATSDSKISDKVFPLYKQKKYGEITIDFFQKIKKVGITGTFDPFTLGHLDLVKYAKEKFDKIYIAILINPDKIAKYSVELRKKMILDSCKDLDMDLEVHYFEGLAIDFCHNEGIKWILRGSRNEIDFAYEREMAEINEATGGVKTLIIPSDKCDVSSGAVRKMLENDESVEKFVSKNIIDLL